MRRSSVTIVVVLGGLLSAVCAMPACGGSTGNGGFAIDGGPGTGSGSGSLGGSSGVSLTGSSSGGVSLSSSGGGASSGGTTSATCPSGWQCNVSCSGGGTTTITGIVKDPAGADPLYNVVAYVPTSPVGTLPSGVPTGSDACSCSALYQGNPIVFALTDTSGKFTITNAPVAQNVPVVIQIGKWRKQITVNTTACGSVDAGTITLPKNGTEGNIPDIAVSTGGADSLECLLVRIGLDASEYVPGWSQPGHVHIYNGGTGPGAGGGGGETNQMTAAPSSSASLWDNTADLMKNDIVLLSCEGAETAGAIPQNLEDYLNAGGRAFASHYHYAWFNGSQTNGYNAPADWGSNLASWAPGGGSSSNVVGGTIVTALTAGGTFNKGTELSTWLGNVGALGQTVLNATGPVPAADVAVGAPRFNASVTNQLPSQSWIQLDTSTDPLSIIDGLFPTLYFSFDTPVSTAANAQYCGRAVFSGLHVGGASYDGVNCNTGMTGKGNKGEGCNTGHVPPAPPPAGCDTTHPLSPQEKVLEYMLFDLSSCVVPDSSDAGAGQIIPPPK